MPQNSIMGAKTLIIDDTKEVRIQIRQCLESIDEIEIIGEAEDGFQGMDMILKEDPELIILDNKMPKMTGTELMTKLKAYGIELKCILTAEHYENMDEQYDAMKDLGVSDIIYKPVDGDVLARLAKKAIKG